MRGNTPEEMLRRYNAVARQVGTIAGVTATKWFKRSFTLQGWQGASGLERWQPRRPGAKRNKGRAILVDSGRLRRSIRTVAKGPSWAVVGTDVPYAAAHNEGSTARATATVRAHSRRGRKGGTHRVRSHPRAVQLNIPRRQFLGDSPGLTNEIAAEVARRLRRAGF